MKRFDDINKDLADLILKMIEVNAEETNINERYDIWTDGSMILTDRENTYDTLVKAFDMLGLAFSTGEPDLNASDGESDHYYIDFD